MGASGVMIPLHLSFEGSYISLMTGNGAPSIINISAFIVFILYDNKLVYKLMINFVRNSLLGNIPDTAEIIGILRFIVITCI